VVRLDLLECVRRAPGTRDRGVVSQEDISFGVCESEAQRCGVAHPAHPGVRVSRFDVAALPLPVDVRDLPRPYYEHDDPRAFDLSCENDRVDLTKFLTSVNDVELGVCREDRDEVLRTSGN